MKCDNKEIFEKQNVFDMGEANTTYANILSGNHF